MTGILNVYVNVSNTSSLLWTQSGSQGLDWYNGQVTIKSTQAYRINIQAVRGSTYASNIAIDDIDFVEKACKIRPDNADPANQVTIPMQTTTRSLRPTSRFDCDFEQDMCIWTIAPDADIQWKRAQGITGSQVSGPLATDHSLGSPEGWYVVADIARPEQVGQAFLISTAMDSRKCMDFYYYFSTNAKFSFDIYAVNAILNKEQRLWKKTSSVGGFWRLGRASVALSGTYTIRMELNHTSAGSPSDIFALDDVFFADGDCVENSDVNNLCTFSDPSMCGYKVNASAAPRFAWNFFMPDISLEEPTPGPIPEGDHTSEGFESGYIYARANEALVNDSTTLISQVYLYSKLEAPVRCLEFYYYLQANNKELQLNVLGKLTTSANRYLFWTRDSNHGHFWWKGEATIKLASNYSILFEAQALADKKNGIVGLGIRFCSTLVSSFPNDF